jgi:hypothetical protein
VNDTDTGPDVPDAVYHRARRAFITEIDRQNRHIDLAAMQLLPEQYTHGAHLKAEVLDRVFSIVNAEADLAALLRPGLPATALAEVLTRWMLLLCGGSIDAEKAIRAVLEAAIPEIDKERDRRAAALDSMLGSAVLTAPGPGPESLTGPGTTDERIALLRQQVHRIEQAMLSQGVSRGVRDRVVSHLLYGEAPQDTARSAPEGAAR